MKKIISVINQKGGVGKSTTAFALGAGLVNKGFNVLFIDLDSQGNLTYTLGAEQLRFSAMDLLLEPIKGSEAVCRKSRWDFIGSSPNLSGADMIITQVGKEYRLKEALESLVQEYDYIIIDTPPALGILTVNALTASTDIIIPAQADIYSIQGIKQLSGTVRTVKKYCNSKLKINGMLFSRYNARSIISREIAETAQQTVKFLNTKLYETKIRECTAIKESQVLKIDIFSYAEKSNAAVDYMNFVDEFLKGE